MIITYILYYIYGCVYVYVFIFGGVYIILKNTHTHTYTHTTTTATTTRAKKQIQQFQGTRYTSNEQSENYKSNSIYSSIQMNKIFKDTFNQGGERLVCRKLQITG